MNQIIITPTLCKDKVVKIDLVLSTGKELSFLSEVILSDVPFKENDLISNGLMLTDVVHAQSIKSSLSLRLINEAIKAGYTLLTESNASLEILLEKIPECAHFLKRVVVVEAAKNIGITCESVKDLRCACNLHDKVKWLRLLLEEGRCVFSEPELYNGYINTVETQVVSTYIESLYVGGDIPYVA